MGRDMKCKIEMIFYFSLYGNFKPKLRWLYDLQFMDIGTSYVSGSNEIRLLVIFKRCLHFSFSLLTPK